MSTRGEKGNKPPRASQIVFSEKKGPYYLQKKAGDINVLKN
jgi:hypothetical protein